MAITDELREYARAFDHVWFKSDGTAIFTTGIPPIDADRGDKHMLRIADRIDAEHERGMDDAWDNGYEADYLGIENWLIEHQQVMEHHGYIELPKDADGEYIHIGDKVTCGASVWEVTGFRFAGGFWGICCTIFNGQGGSGTNVYPPSELHHYRASTVEEVLTEFGIDWEHEDNCEDRAALLKEYAAKLQLKEQS